MSLYMLENLSPQAPDALLALIKMYASDPRADKIDLGVGVYRTDEGDTPVFAAVKQAEQKLLSTQSSKSYLGPEGDMGFVNGLMPYIFGADATMGGRITGMQTPGGTGAVRIAVALAQKAGIKCLHIGKPSWPNHAQIFDDIHLETRWFQHAREDGSACLEAVLDVISKAEPRDAILLHGACHNPTGIDYTNADWEEIAKACADSGIFPIIDLAYQGLGDGMEEDAYGLRSILKAVPEAFVAYSCDKNFGVYRDRVGAFYAMVRDPAGLETVFSNANAIARASWSMPPDHGASAIRLILRDVDLTDAWLAELEHMRKRMRSVRASLGQAGVAGSIELAPLASQNGLFSMLPVSPDQVKQLREDHGIYMAGSGRINIAGLHTGNIEKFIAAIATVAA